MKKIGFAAFLIAALLIPTIAVIQIAPHASSIAPITIDKRDAPYRVDSAKAYDEYILLSLSEGPLDLPSYEVTFNITAPDDSPATYTYIWVFSGYPPERRFPERFPEGTGESNTATFTLMPGNYTAVFWRPQHLPRFFALYQFYVSSDATLNLKVGSPDIPTVPVTLQVVKPLEDRPLSQGRFNLLLLDYMCQPRRTPSYSSDSPGTTLIYLMPNYRYGFSYMDDYVGKYLLFKPNVKVTATTTTVTIDASNVGFVKPVFELPIEAIFDDYDLSIWLKGSKAPFAWLDYGKEENISIAITPGTYEAWHCLDGYYKDAEYHFEIYNPKLSVKGKAMMSVNWGGSLKAFLKCDKKSYKIGDTVKLNYWFEDGFKNKVAFGYYYNSTTEEEGVLLPMLNIYDPSNQFVQSVTLPEFKWKTHYYFWTSGVPPGEYSFEIGNFIAPGKYKLEIVLDTGPYQEEVSTYINITIKK